MTDPMKPNLQLLTKLGSALAHADEGLSEDGHDFDVTEFQTRMADPQVVEWLEGMRKLCLLPLRRNL